MSSYLDGVHLNSWRSGEGVKQRTINRNNKGKVRKPSLDELITQTEAARIRRVTTAAISDLIRRGRLSSINMFGKNLVYRTEFILLEKLKPGPKTETE